jgi:hypothetical protein
MNDGAVLKTSPTKGLSNHGRLMRSIACTGVLSEEVETGIKINI